MPCSPLCTSYLWVEFEGRTFTLITFRSERVKFPLSLLVEVCAFSNSNLSERLNICITSSRSFSIESLLEGWIFVGSGGAAVVIPWLPLTVKMEVFCPAG